MKKSIYLEILRILAIILVVFNHTDGFFLYYSTTENPLTWWFSFLGSVICKINVPLFLMISGAVLLEREETVGELFGKRISRIAVLLVLFSLPYYITHTLREGGLLSLSAFLRGLAEGSIQESFWYLYLYLGLLLLLPLLRRAVMGLRDSELRYLFCLQMVLCVAFPLFSWMTGISVSGGFGQLNYYMAFLLSGYYLGRRLRMEKISGLQAGGILFLAVLCIAGTWGIVSLDYAGTGEYRRECLDFFIPVLTSCVFLLTRWWCDRHSFSAVAQRLILSAGSCVLGIYLVEQLSRMVLLPMYLYLCEHTFGVFACCCYVAGSLALSGVCAFWMKKLPVLRRLL